MNENDLFNFQLEYTFTADWLAELDRQLALLLSTREGTMPLDRAFGLNMDFVICRQRPQRAFTRRRSPKRCPNSYRRCGCRK